MTEPEAFLREIEKEEAEFYERIKPRIAQKARERWASRQSLPKEKEKTPSTKKLKKRGAKPVRKSTISDVKLPHTLTVHGVQEGPKIRLIILRDESGNFYTIPRSSLLAVQSVTAPYMTIPNGPTKEDT